MRVAGNPGVVGFPVVRAVSRVSSKDCMSCASFVGHAHRRMSRAQVAWNPCAMANVRPVRVTRPFSNLPIAVTG